MPQLALYLTAKVSTANYSRGDTVPVVDRSGIEGVWNVVLQNTVTNPETVSMVLMDKNGMEDREPPVYSYQRVLSRIGFKLERAKAPVDRMVVDHIDLYVEN